MLVYHIYTIIARIILSVGTLFYNSPVLMLKTGEWPNGIIRLPLWG